MMTVQTDGSGADRRIPLSRHRRAVAANMTLSARIPQFGLYKDVDMSRLKELRSSVAPDRTFSYSDAITAASACALRDHPAVNASFDEEENCIIEHGAINIGLAVAGATGLIVVVIQDADRRTPSELAQERQRLTLAAKNGTLESRDVFGATLVISNLGPAGVDMFQALLLPPLAAIVAVGALRDAPATDGTAPASRVVVTLCLTLDHRVLDGLAGAAFLNTVAASLENPDWLIAPESARSERHTS